MMKFIFPLLLFFLYSALYGQSDSLSGYETSSSKESINRRHAITLLGGFSLPNNDLGAVKKPTYENYPNDYDNIGSGWQMALEYEYSFKRRIGLAARFSYFFYLADRDLLERAYLSSTIMGNTGSIDIDQLSNSGDRSIYAFILSPKLYLSKIKNEGIFVKANVGLAQQRYNGYQLSGTQRNFSTTVLRYISESEAYSDLVLMLGAGLGAKVDPTDHIYFGFCFDFLYAQFSGFDTDRTSQTISSSYEDTKYTKRSLGGTYFSFNIGFNLGYKF